MGIFFFWQGPRPPQATMWLRPWPLGPLEAETKAMNEAVSFAKDIGLQDVIFETNSTTILGALTDTFTTLACITACKVFEEHRYDMLADMETGQHIFWHIVPEKLIILLHGLRKFHRVLNFCILGCFIRFIIKLSYFS